MKTSFYVYIATFQQASDKIKILPHKVWLREELVLFGIFHSKIQLEKNEKGKFLGAEQWSLIPTLKSLPDEYSKPDSPADTNSGP